MFELPFEWQEYMIKLISYAGENPWQFLYYTLLILSPLFALSAFLSYKLIQEIDKKESETKKKQLKDANRLKVTRKKNE